MTCLNYGIPQNETINFSTAISEIQSFENLLTYKNNPTARFDDADLTDSIRYINDMMQSIDMSEYNFLRRKVHQQKLTKFELADFMIKAGINMDYMKAQLEIE